MCFIEGSMPEGELRLHAVRNLARRCVMCQIRYSPYSPGANFCAGLSF